MRSRNIRVSIRLNEKEKADLDRKVKLSGLSRNTFLQKLIEDRKILPIPPQPFFDILKELREMRLCCADLAWNARRNGYDAKPFFVYEKKLETMVSDIIQTMYYSKKEMEEKYGTINKS